MTRFSVSLVLPDVNVWLALAYAGHPGHWKVRSWFDALHGIDLLCFCRVTQMSFLRLLTQSAVVGASCLNQEQAWAAYDALLLDPRITFKSEPAELDSVFRSISARPSIAPKLWTDDYLLAFAQASGLTLATLDRTLGARAANGLLLG